MKLPTSATPLVERKTGRLYNLGTVEYARAYRLQERLCHARANNEIDDTILVMQHPPVLTVGKGGYEPEHVLVPRETLENEKITVFQTNRGGGITYHGPGQLVCYPIFNLKELGLTVRQYIARLEEVVILSLACFGIIAIRVAGAPGLWVGDAEISSIGIHVSHGITMHGFTLNVNNNLKPFSFILPCGVKDKKITTVTELYGYGVPAEWFVPAIIRSFNEAFDLDIKQNQPAIIKEYDE